MAIPKTLGIETEYGIVHKGTDDPNPIAASSVLINAYLYRKLRFSVGDPTALVEISGGNGESR